MRNFHFILFGFGAMVFSASSVWAEEVKMMSLTAPMEEVLSGPSANQPMVIGSAAVNQPHALNMRTFRSVDVYAKVTSTDVNGASVSKFKLPGDCQINVSHLNFGPVERLGFAISCDRSELTPAQNFILTPVTGFGTTTAEFEINIIYVD